MSKAVPSRWRTSFAGETTNLADKHPKKVAELKALMKAIAEGKG